jgi:hypothetical protein
VPDLDRKAVEIMCASESFSRIGRSCVRFIIGAATVNMVARFLSLLENLDIHGSLDMEEHIVL